MKTALLAGGRGTRMGNAFGDLPKALVPIGGRPILHHVMGHYAGYGFRDFVVALGHGGNRIRDYFSAAIEQHPPLPFDVRLVDTGEDTATGGRILRLRPHLGAATFMLTWCDGLGDIDVHALLDFHRSHGRLATVTAVHPPARFGQLALDGARVARFVEKPERTGEWINGAYFVLEPGVFDCIAGDPCSWEHDVLPRLAEQGQLMAWRHESFWQCMDTPHERALLEQLWLRGEAPWRSAG